ncbi:lipase family protein [Olivibacter sitiensis]|uniref:lipase family protein n=1 Tax=Olivibacter sitiensis TaxID=376470 RepID=UPI0004245FA0|nr:lipase family protein [Olivibacter sitiensis]
MRAAFAWSILLIIKSLTVLAQGDSYRFKTGFDPNEYADLMHLNEAFMDTIAGNRFIDYDPNFSFLYRSPSMGMDNTYDIWKGKDSTIVVTLRGTTADTKSLLADFYCAMIPANGKIVFGENDTLAYKLSSLENATVHAGWLIGFAFIARDFKPKLDSLYGDGYRKFIVAGHSQGGALCYYLSAWMWHLNEIYPDIRVKTYASASPKVGNMYFAYDYDNTTRSIWTFSVTNSADLVPETPFTTQVWETDMNQPNPFINMEETFKKLSFLKRIMMKKAYNKMRNSANKSSAAYQKYLGDYLYKWTQNIYPHLELPQAVNTAYFVRPGVPISFVPNEAYRQFFDKNNDGPYFHHSFKAYLFLLNEYYETSKKNN